MRPAFTHSLSLSLSLLLCLSSRLTTFTISAQWKTQHTSRICCLRHQFNLKTFSAILPPSHTHTHTHPGNLIPWHTLSLSLLPAHRGRHHSCLSPRLCFIALRFGATKIVAYFAARPVNWVVLHSLNKSLDVRLRGLWKYDRRAKWEEGEGREVKDTLQFSLSTGKAPVNNLFILQILLCPLLLKLDKQFRCFTSRRYAALGMGIDRGR